MELFNFFHWALATTIAVVMLWPVNVPILALAYKVQHGPNPIPMERSEFWTRSTFAALVLAVAGLGCAVVDYLLVTGADLPAGPIHLMVFMAFLPAGAWLLFWMYAMDDLGPAFSLLLIYLCLPGFVLTLLTWLGLWFPVGLAESWLAKPS